MSNVISEPLDKRTEKLVRYLKGIFSIIALIVFLVTLCEDDHDVRGFYTSLLIQSSSQIIDLILFKLSLDDNERIEKSSKLHSLLAVVSASLCFILSVLLLILSNSFWFINAYLNGTLWPLTFILFPIIIYAFVINIWRPQKEIDFGIPIEHRA